MKKSDLLKYLNDCKDLEMSIYTQEQELSKLKNYANSLGRAINYKKPEKQQNVIVDEFTIVLGVFAGALVDIIIIPILMYFDLTELSIFIGILILLAGAAIAWILQEAKEEKQNETKYKQDMANYSWYINEDAKRVQQELEQKKIVETQISTIEAQLADTKSTLEKLYDVDVIYPKYRALVPVVMFCEYLESMRCSQLTGHEGAYNIYESELRQNLIISKLNDVINQLEQIKENKWKLYDAIERGNRKVDQLCNIGIDNAKRLQRIEDNEAIRAENERITAQNTQTLKDIEIYKMIWK
ncbi:MAG: hypothetical protein ACI4IJ_09975 [Acutalibacteraceae bacterium]